MKTFACTKIARPRLFCRKARRFIVTVSFGVKRLTGVVSWFLLPWRFPVVARLTTNLRWWRIKAPPCLTCNGVRRVATAPQLGAEGIRMHGYVKNRGQGAALIGHLLSVLKPPSYDSYKHKKLKYLRKIDLPAPVLYILRESGELYVSNDRS